MLTATYSIVTISTEQKNARSILSKLQQVIRNTWNTVKNFDLSSIESALEKLKHYDRYCHSRKVELYVIPAARGASHEIDQLIGELETLKLRGLHILRSLQQQLHQALAQKSVRIADLCESMDQYCRNRMEMLAKEENELLPLVRRSLSSDAWFAIAAQFLSDRHPVKVEKPKL